jgi:hypothetical protein
MVDEYKKLNSHVKVLRRYRLDEHVNAAGGLDNYVNFLEE